MKNFSIVSYLSDGELNSVRNLQEKLSKITGSTKSLKSWLPHITVGDAISIPDDILRDLEIKLHAFSKDYKSISVHVKGFGGTKNWGGAVSEKISPDVIWIDLNLSTELKHLFNNLRDQITSNYNTWLPRIKNYQPHVTLAFFDLTEEGYKKGIEFLKTQKSEKIFHINSISLVECYGEGNMTSSEYKRFNLN
ncbi:MAG TPA: 2'-5' RNA ligase family protein [Candidatus Paceibacterota bacterium]|nr:2'-5' RNA ligase family protein [Candidatus Paceibacterota bacterium]